jgi:vanillate/3-O-methylgallate O-demethylase
MLSLGIVDPNVDIGTEVNLVWGEENGGTKKITVERHKQLNIRATVSAVPYSKFVRETYAAGWRTAK